MTWGKRILLLVLLLCLGAIVFFRASSGAALPTGSDPKTEATAEPLAFATPPVELSAVLTAEQLRALDASALQRLDLSGSVCYDEIEAFIARHPGVEVIYQILLEGGDATLSLDPDTRELDVHDASLLASLTDNAVHLPKLSTVRIDADIASGEAVDALREALPEAEIQYDLLLDGVAYPYDTETLNLTGLNTEKLEALLPQLARFNHLQAVNLPQDGNDIPLEDATRLSAANPLLRLHYQIELFGQSVSMDDERLEFENLALGDDDLAQLRSLLPYMSNLQYLKLDDCGFSNEQMEALRDENPDVKVVWRVHFGSYHCLTDTEMIWATGGSVNDGTAGVLKYCTDVKYIDLGHSLITNLDFLRYMPKLEVAIFAITWVEDISAIANCPELEYLEIFSARVQDLSPLASCTHLQHLNISGQRNSNNVAVGPTDISSLYDLPELKRFYCAMSYVPESQQQEMMDRHPDCEFEFRWVDPAEGPWRFEADGKTPNERYALLKEQFGYDSLQQSGKIWSLYG